MSPRFGLTIDLAGFLISFVALIIALVIVIRTFSKATYPPESNKPYNPKDFMGHTEWDFSKSWATNLTAIGTLLATLLGAFKGSPFQYSLLSIFFLLLAVLAPLIYSFIGKPVKANATFSSGQDGFNTTALMHALAQPEAPPILEKNIYRYQGYIWGFLVASAVTLWAVLGEVITIIFLLGDLPNTAPNTPPNTPLMSPLILLIQIFLLIFLILIGYYGWKTIPWTLQEQFSQQKADVSALTFYVSRTQDKNDKELTDYIAENPKPELPSWSLL